MEGQCDRSWLFARGGYDKIYIKIAVPRRSKERDAEKEREREEDFCLIIEIRSCRNENEGKTRLVCLFR